MYTSFKALVVFIALASSVWAEDLPDLPDDALLGKVVIATENGEKEQLLNLMREVQARGLLMFPKPQACTFSYPDTEFFNNEIFRGAVRWGFGTDLQERAVAQGFCGCIYDLGSLNAFTQERIGKTPEDLTAEDFSALRRYRSDEWVEIDQLHTAFRKESCGD
ncbi:MAG: hypothetical protein H5U14_09165 [Roseovarius sp.]|nr:hypothetical protein [Roseovarius sp.]